jgi:ankyrin repeat protein
MVRRMVFKIRFFPNLVNSCRYILAGAVHSIAALCAVGANMDYETSEHKSALHWAAEVGRLDSIGGLLKRGASVGLYS